MSRPRNCSGDMNAGVPTRVPATVSPSSSVSQRIGGDSFASPKSSTFSRPRSEDDVVRLDVAMNDAGRVGRPECLRRMPMSTTSAASACW